MTTLASAAIALAVSGLTLFAGIGCEARSAAEIFPEYAAKNQAGQLEESGATDPRPAGRAPTFFPGRNID